MQRIFLNVGYELSEKQLRVHFSTFGVLSDLYLPKHTNGRNKGYGFATFASETSLSSALQQSKHMVNGIVVQIKRAGARPADVPTVTPKTVPPCFPEPFGRGPRIYVGGIPDNLSEDRLRQHFLQWGPVSDVYFPGAKGQKRLNYCFVTFEDRVSAERACNESARSLDGWSLKSISMAEDRKDTLHQAESSPHGSPQKQPPTAEASHAAVLAAAAAELPGYTDWLHLQYQKQLEAAIASMSFCAHASPNRLDAQTSSHYPVPTSASSGLEQPYLQPNLNSPFLSQPWDDSTSSQGKYSSLPPPIKSLSTGFEAFQHVPFSTGLPAAAADGDVSSPSMEYLVMLAQLNMQHASEAGHGRQAAADHVQDPAHFGGSGVHSNLASTCNFGAAGPLMTPSF